MKRHYSSSLSDSDESPPPHIEADGVIGDPTYADAILDHLAVPPASKSAEKAYDEIYLEHIARVLLDKLALMAVEQLHSPISESKVREMAEALTKDPADRRTLPRWARQLALSERSLSRLMLSETGFSFGTVAPAVASHRRLEELATGYSVQEVSGDLGYNSVTAFITMCKKATGQSSARYFAPQRSCRHPEI